MANLADLGIGVFADSSDFGKEISKVPDAADDAVDETVNIFDGMGGKLAAAAKAAGAAAGAALVVGVVGAVNIDGATNKLAAQLDLTEADSERAGSIAGELYADAYGESIGQVNEAVGAVISSLPGFRTASDDALTAASTKALDFAGTFDTDVQRAVASAGIVMTSGLAGDATEAFDLITAASQNVPSHLREDVLDASDEYSQFFSQLGFDGQKAFSVLVAGAADGMYGIDKAGDAVKEFTIRSTDMSTASQDAYEAIGLDAAVMADKILAGGDTASEGFGQIIDGLLGMEDPTARANAAIALFGTPLEDLGTSEIPAFLESLRGMEGGLANVEGASDRMGQKLNKGPGVALESLKRSFFRVATDVGGIFLPSIAEGAEALTGKIGPAVETASAFINDDLIPAVQTAAQWVDEFRVPIGIVAGLLVASYIPAIVRSGIASTVSGGKQVLAWATTRAAAIKTVALAPVHAARIVAGWVAQAAAAVVSGAQTAAVWLMYRVEAAKSAVAHVAQAARVVGGWVLMGAQSLVQGARMAAAWVIAMGPVGWVIAAVVGLVALIVANWDTVVGWTKKAWTWVTDKIGAAWDWIKDSTSRAVSAVVGFLGNLRDRAVAIVGRIVDFVERYHPIMILWRLAQQWVPRAIGWFTNLRDRAVSIFTGLRDRAVSTITGLMDRVRGIKDDVLGFFSGAGRWLWDAGKNIIIGLIDGIGSMIGKVGDMVGNVVSKVTDFLPWSPAKEGPLRTHPPEEGGANIVALMARGMGSEVGSLSAMANRAAAAALPGLGVPSIPRIGSIGASDQTGGVRRIRLVVGEREFDAYLEESYMTNRAREASGQAVRRGGR